MAMTISLIRTLLLYIVIIVAVRLMGKRQISELQTSELVVTLLISDIAAIPMQETGQPLVSGFLPIAVLVMCEIVVSVLLLAIPKFRRVVCGRPIVVISDGKLIQSEMKRLRMSTEDLGEQLRQRNVFSLDDVAYAIIKTNGKLSVIKKPDKETPTAGMMGVALPNTGIETVVISDGILSEFAMKLCNKSPEWIRGILHAKNIRQEDVFIMTANTKGDYNIIPKERGTSL